MLSLTKVNALLCIALFFNPYALAEPVSSAVNGIQGEGQKYIIVPSKESLKNETTVSSSKNEIATTPLPISPTKELKLTQIIIDIDKPGKYVFGIYPINNKNKNTVENSDIIWPRGTVTIYDMTNEKIISIIDLESKTETYGNRVDKTEGITFSVEIEKESKYLITPKALIESNAKINENYSFSIHRNGFIK